MALSVRIVDEHSRFVDFKLTARRDANAAKAFLKQACTNCGLYPPMTIVTDKAPTYPAIFQAMKPHAYTDQPISHVDQKGSNNRIESDHASLKRINATIPAIRQFFNVQPPVMWQLFKIAVVQIKTVYVDLGAQSVKVS